MEQGNQIKKDRRLFERIPTNLPVRLKKPKSITSTLASACDVNARGIGIVSKEPLTPGNPLELWIEFSPQKEPFYTKGTVVWIICNYF